MRALGAKVRGRDAGKHSNDSAGGMSAELCLPAAGGKAMVTVPARQRIYKGGGSLSLFWTEIEVTGLSSRVHIQRISLDTAGNRVSPVLSGTSRGTDGRPGARVTRPHSGGRPSHPGTRRRSSQPGEPSRAGPTDPAPRHHAGKAVPSPRTRTDQGFTGHRPGRVKRPRGRRTRSRPEGFVRPDCCLGFARRTPS